MHLLLGEVVVAVHHLVLTDLAVAYEQQGEFAKARDASEKALKLRPGDDLIQQNFDLFREADDKRNRKTKSSSKDKDANGKAPADKPAAAAPAPPADVPPAEPPAPETH